MLLLGKLHHYSTRLLTHRFYQEHIQELAEVYAYRSKIDTHLERMKMNTASCLSKYSLSILKRSIAVVDTGLNLG